ncbi:MAG: hypothetical protein ABL995_04245 [Bryobacteraceae bacterium]
MTKNFFLGFVGLVAPASLCVAQVQTPLMGVAPDGGALRPMYGMPSSGSLGRPMPAPGNLNHSAVAPGGSVAIGVTPEEGRPVVVKMGPDGAKFAEIPGAAQGADHVCLSPKGSAALLLNSATGVAQVVSGLAAEAAVGRSLDFSGATTLHATAVSDDGAWVVASTDAGVIAYGPQGQTVTLPVAGAVTALTFLNSSLDVVATTATEVTLISEINGLANAQALYAGAADAPPPPESPIAIAVSEDNNHVVLIEPSGGIGHINRATGAVTVADCQCAPAGLFSLGGTVFRVTAVDGGSAKVYDAVTDSVWFVPQALDLTDGGAQ